MYISGGNSGSVRENGPPYGAAAPDRFPADDVLADLATGEEDDGFRTTRILARYAALRAWLLRTTHAPARLARHADSAAREHLDAVLHWPEGRVLRELLDADAARAESLLGLAAAEAGACGDPQGAAALRGAAGEARRLRLREGRRGR